VNKQINSKDSRRFFMAAKQSTVLTLDIMDSIGENIFGGGITATAVSEAIKNAGDFTSVTVNINSPGGSLFDGVAIYNILKALGKPVNVVVLGLAASAASAIACAGDTVTMGLGSQYMLHNAMAMEAGYASDMRKMADILDSITDSAADIYVAKTGMKKDKVLSLMGAETWYGAEDAVKNGFATSVAKNKGNAVSACFDLSVFKNTPADLKSAPVTAVADIDSYEDIIAEVSSALNEAFPDKYWTCDTYPDNVIACDYAGSGDYFRIPYTEDEATEKYTFGTPQPVEKEWVPSTEAQARLAAKLPVVDPTIAVMRKRIELMRARN
jgi:ATP-dependent protease ClpP protease subunit